jgi:hypothetical protein
MLIMPLNSGREKVLKTPEIDWSCVCTFASNFRFANLYIATQSANIARISVTNRIGGFQRGYDCSAMRFKNQKI